MTDIQRSDLDYLLSASRSMTVRDVASDGWLTELICRAIEKRNEEVMRNAAEIAAGSAEAGKK